MGPADKYAEIAGHAIPRHFSNNFEDSIISDNLFLRSELVPHKQPSAFVDS